MHTDNNKRVLIGPFKQILTMDAMPLYGHLTDSDLEIIDNGGLILCEEKIIAVNRFPLLEQQKDYEDFHEISTPSVLIPGLIDAHTHICFAGSRAHDFALRLSGVHYQEIAAKGGGILDTVKNTRAASEELLVNLLVERLSRLLKLGVTTCEIKSGYGLSIEQELKILRAISQAREIQPISLVSTCLAAHKKPPEFNTPLEYLKHLIDVLFPQLQNKKLTNRLDIFIEEGAFSIEEARYYLIEGKKRGFSLCLHADQFSEGGALLAAELHALSADHLEKSSIHDIRALKNAGVIPIVLPGSSIGLGEPFANAHLMLDEGLSLVIASDWNPGSAPMGNLVTQASILGAAQYLTMAEIWSGITIRAANALQLFDRGALKPGLRADLVTFPCSDYQEILYHQGSMTPNSVYVGGKKVL